MAAAADGDALSAREGEVARLYVDGLSYKEIARDLEISPATVRTHLNTIYRKLEVSSRIELLHRLGGNGAGGDASAAAAAEPVAPPAAPVPRTERRQLTVMFVDLVGSTALAAGMDAEDMHELLQAYRAAVRAQVEAADGHVAGFPGDGVVACFGWPRALEDAAERAVRAGLAIQAAIGKLSAPGGAPLQARIGIATGVVVVDGSKGDADSLTGGTPNLAARLQSVAEPGGLVIAQATRELIGDLFAVESLGEHEIKGLPAAVPVFRVTGELQAESRFEARHAGSIAPMVGRDLELALLLERWERAKEGEGQAVLLTGEPGIGKSRIAAALLDAVSSETNGGATPLVLRYQTSPQQGDSPLWPVRRQLTLAAELEPSADDETRLRRLEAFLNATSPVSAETLALVAELLDIETTTKLPTMSATRRRERIIEVLTERLLALARKSPVLLLFEDLHWVDPSSLELVDRLIAQTADARVMLLATSRPEDEPRLAGHAHLTRVSLSRLGRTAATLVIQRQVGERQITDELVQTILERTDGVPLYLEEMTQAILEAGGAATEVPASLYDSLMARLDRQGDAKEIAQLAACIGREVDPELLHAVADRNAAAMKEAIDRLVAAELLFRRGQGYVFKHALVQDVAYQSLLRSRRAELHGRIAETLLGRFRSRAAAEPQTVAHHLEQAGRTEAAIDYYSLTADLANDKGANREAKRYLERVLRLTETLPTSRERDRREVAALTMLGKVTAAIEGHASPVTAAVYQQALERCRKAELGLSEFPIVLGLTVLRAVEGSTHEAMKLAQRLAELIEGIDDQTLAVEADYALGITHSWRGDLALAQHHLELARQHYSIDQHPRHLALYGQDPGVVCGCRGAMTLWYMGLPDQAAAQFEASMALANQLGHSFSTNYVLNWIAMHALECGDRAAAEAAVTATLEHAAEQGFGTWLALGDVCRARFLLEHGTLDEALEACVQALKEARSTGSGCFEGLGLVLLGETLRRRREPEQGLARIEEAMQVIERGGARWIEVEALRRRAACERDLGAEDAAGATLETALAVARRQGARMLELRVSRDLATHWAERGDPARGHALVSQCLAGFSEGHETRDLRAARVLLQSLDG